MTFFHGLRTNLEKHNQQRDTVTTKILHVSDTHLGIRQYRSEQRRQDFADAFEQAIDKAIDHEVDAVIHTGDLFDKRTPGLPDLNTSIKILRKLDDAGIPFYGIVGNHERKMDEQWLDLLNQAGVAERLDRTPTVVNDEVALYGVDAIPKPAWESMSFDLETGSLDGEYRILCMHQLLHPPTPEIMAEYETEEVLNRLNALIDAIALGDYHKPSSKTINGVDVWYPGSTERNSRKESEKRRVSLLTIDNDELDREELPLDTRGFVQIDIKFAEGDGLDYAESRINEREVEEKVVLVELSGEDVPVRSSDIHNLLSKRGVTVGRVKDTRKGVEVGTELPEAPEVTDFESHIDEQLSEKDLSRAAVEIEKMVRRTETAAHVRDEADDIVEEAYKQRFGDGNVESSEVPEQTEEVS